jgi:hypothetical protein
MRLLNRGFNLYTNRIPLSRVFLVLITAGLLSSFLIACDAGEPEIEESAPLTSSNGALVVEGSDIEEVNSAIKCDGELDENGSLKPGTTANTDQNDNCDTISGVPYFQSDPEEPDSGAIYYRESPGANIVVVHDHYTPSPSFWYVGPYSRTVIMPSSMMYSGGSPVFQGSRAVLSTATNTSTVTRTPMSLSNGRGTVIPVKSSATFVTPLTRTSINGGKISTSHISASSTKITAPASSFKSSVRSAPSRASSVGRGVSVGGKSSSGG